MSTLFATLSQIPLWSSLSHGFHVVQKIPSLPKPLEIKQNSPSSEVEPHFVSSSSKEELWDIICSLRFNTNIADTFMSAGAMYWYFFGPEGNYDCMILVSLFKANPVIGFLIVCHFKSMQCNTSILSTSMTGLKIVTASKTWNYKSRSKKTMPSSVYSCNNQFKSYMYRFSALCKFNFQLVMIECEIQPQNSSIHSILTSIL